MNKEIILYDMTEEERALDNEILKYESKIKELQNDFNKENRRRPNNQKDIDLKESNIKKIKAEISYNIKKRNSCMMQLYGG